MTIPTFHPVFQGGPEWKAPCLGRFGRCLEQNHVEWRLPRQNDVKNKLARIGDRQRKIERDTLPRLQDCLRGALRDVHSPCRIGKTKRFERYR